VKDTTRSDRTRKDEPVSLTKFRPVDADERWILGPDDDEPTPTLLDIRRFVPNGDRDSIVTADLPRDVRRALKTVGDDAERPMSHLCVWSLERGCRRLGSLSDVGTVSDAQAALRAANSVHVAQLENWSYRVQAREGSQPLTVRHVGKTERNRLLGIAEGLGLSQSRAAAIAVVLGLADAPSLPADLSDLLAGEVRAFLVALRRQADGARDLIQLLAAKKPAVARQRSWSDLVR
jgi:hypothetical protein